MSEMACPKCSMKSIVINENVIDNNRKVLICESCSHTFNDKYYNELVCPQNKVGDATHWKSNTTFGSTTQGKTYKLHRNRHKQYYIIDDNKGKTYVLWANGCFLKKLKK